MNEMDKPLVRFVEGQRVRLRDGVNPEFYGGMSCTGNEGWVKATQLDERYGYPKIFVEWDKDHWAYNQAPDTWTWEGHFEEVDMPDENNEKDLFQEFLKWKKEQASPSKDEKGVARYARIMEEAAESLGKSEAFIILTATRGRLPQIEEDVLQVEIHRDALTEAGELACNVRAADLAGLLYAELALSQRKDDDAGSR